MKYQLGLIGAGKMGGAILSAALREGKVAPGAAFVCDARDAALKPFAKMGVAVTNNPAELARECKTTLIAVKPQDFGALLSSLSGVYRPTQLVVSIAAGKTIATMRALLGPNPRLVRVMPNLAAQVGAGFIAYAPDTYAKAADIRRVQDLFGACGCTMRLDEPLLDAVTALGGSGPAFFAYVAQAMALGGEALGFMPGEANVIALQTMLGTARYLLETKQDIPAFIKAVCSPNGTTEAGMKVLEASTVADTMAKTLAAAAKRSRELAN